jgi:hypothetical protein
MRDSRDRRTCQVELTGDGAQLATRSHGDVTARLETLAAELQPADRKRLTSAVMQIVARHRTATPSWSGPSAAEAESSPR